MTTGDLAFTATLLSVLLIYVMAIVRIASLRTARHVVREKGFQTFGGDRRLEPIGSSSDRD